MKHAKSTITRLKTKVIETLPDDNNIYNFNGINKIIIIDCLDEAHSLLKELETKPDSFEVVFLKRNLIHISNLANENLKDLNRPFSNKEKEFNLFLENVFNMTSKIKETYILVVTKAIRNEADLIYIKDSIDTYNGILTNYKTLSESLDLMSNNINRVESEIIAFHDEYKNSEEFVSSTCDDLKLKQSELNEIYNDVIDSKEYISDKKEKISDIEVKFEMLTKTSKVQLESLNESVSNIDELNKYSEEVQEKINNLNAEINAILSDANRASMASSFLKRKEELTSPINKSSNIMNIALIAIGAISFYLLKISGFGNGDFNYQDFLIKLPIIAPFIWIAWSNSQRNNYLVRIQEDYAFKAASAMAFEGYNQQVQDVDEDLQKKLLSLSIDCMGANPIRLFNDKVKNTPTSEFTDFASSLMQNIKPTIKTKQTDKED
ncbi:hypothetical protein C9I86_02490 [Photobacterium sp. NCIMB 13483]|uniref:hypothetical protein n=1 Tax=Photobacterium sp. NCIMB 13483 TaxID=2022103 RepID=UPI000D17183C|nr:hypothetical protein [Photobacterium sp. NCIMB 13483]PST94241.1 hypothetical protein C9I86_02490 [Photobacterium sp. NCIMB 13483]